MRWQKMRRGKVYLQIRDATFYPGEKHPNASKYRRRLEKEPGIPGVLDLMLFGENSKQVSAQSKQ